MNRKEIQELEKQQALSTKRQNFLDKYGGAPLASIMRNPKITPTILLVLAIVPFVIATFILTLVFLWQ